MLNINLEKLINNYPKPITYENTKTILNQMGRYICQIKIEKERGTGFFCKLPFPDYNNLLPVLITNNHVINQNILNNNQVNITIDRKEENKSRIINLNNRITYTNVLRDITIIELKEQDEINDFLELDENIINDGCNEGYIGQSIYIIHYPKEILSVSYGILYDIPIDLPHNFGHLCCTEEGSSGSPILNCNNNKLIGVHQGSSPFKYNLGIFLKDVIKDFQKEIYCSSKYQKITLLKEFNEKYNNCLIQALELIKEAKIGSKKAWTIIF